MLFTGISMHLYSSVEFTKCASYCSIVVLLDKGNHTQRDEDWFWYDNT
jgi:hypothetical protein